MNPAPSGGQTERLVQACVTKGVTTGRSADVALVADRIAQPFEQAFDPRHSLAQVCRFAADTTYLATDTRNLGAELVRARIDLGPDIADLGSDTADLGSDTADLGSDTTDFVGNLGPDRRRSLRAGYGLRW